MTTTRETLKALLDRGDLLPWINGETEIYFNGAKRDDNPHFFFGLPPEEYTFRPIPKPPVRVLRPWTWEEFLPHVNDWYRFKSDGAWLRIEVVYNRDSQVRLNSSTRCMKELSDVWEHLSPSGEWLPCGTWTTEGGEA